MPEQNNYICRLATLEEVENRWNNIIQKEHDKEMYNRAKEEFLQEIKNNTRMTYIGLLNNKIICDITVITKIAGIKKEAGNIQNLINEHRAFLCAIRTDKEYENKGYFSKLLKYIEQDLLIRGYTELSLAVDHSNKKNQEIYKHLGFINQITTEIKEGNGTIYTFHYLYKTIKSTSN